MPTSGEYEHGDGDHGERGVGGAPGLGAGFGGSQPVPEAGEGGEERDGTPADEGERPSPVEVTPPRVVLPEDRDDVERRDEDVGADGDVGQRWVERLAGPSSEALDVRPRKVSAGERKGVA